MKHIPKNSIVLLEVPQIACELNRLEEFLAQYGRETMPEGDDLAGLMNRFIIYVSGYDQDGREVYEIPEVRAYMTSLHRAWPYILFFHALEKEYIRTLIYCMIPIEILYRDTAMSRVAIKGPDLLEFLQSGAAGLEEMCHRANLPASLIDERMNRICEMFGI